MFFFPSTMSPAFFTTVCTLPSSLQSVPFLLPPACPLPFSGQPAPCFLHSRLSPSFFTSSCPLPFLQNAHCLHTPACTMPYSPMSPAFYTPTCSMLSFFSISLQKRIRSSSSSLTHHRLLGLPCISHMLINTTIYLI